MKLIWVMQMPRKFSAILKKHIFASFGHTFLGITYSLSLIGYQTFEGAWPDAFKALFSIGL